MLARKLDMAKISALSLYTAACELDAAANVGAFRDALEFNHRIWRAVTRLAADLRWPVPDPRQSRFALATSAGRTVSDGDLSRIRERAYLQWQNHRSSANRDFDLWLLGEVENPGCPLRPAAVFVQAALGA